MNRLVERDLAVRAMLVDRVERQEPRRRRTTALIAVVSFVLGGGLAVGAMSAAAAAPRIPVPDTPTDQMFAGMTPGGHTVGALFSYTGSGDAHLDLGTRPDGVTGIAYILQCTDGRGALTSSMGGEAGHAATCRTGSGFGETTTGDPTDSTVTITTDGGFSYVVWAKWIAVPPPAAAVAPSAAQKAAVADGKVSTDEYHAALDRFAACMTGAGFPVTITSYDTGSYRDPGADTGDAGDYAASTRCAQAEWNEVAALWRAQGSRGSD